MTTATQGALYPENKTNIASLVSYFALGGALCIFSMVLIFFMTGIGQEPLQAVRSSQDYAALLLKNPAVLRYVIGVDNLFLMLYTAMFISLGSCLWKLTAQKFLLAAALSLLVMNGFLDLVENLHYLSMIACAVQGLDISLQEIQWQTWETMLKFHVSYFGVFLLSFVMPGDTKPEMVLRQAMRWIYLPVGILIYVLPPEVIKPLVFARFIFFFLALLGLSYVFQQRRFYSNAQV